MKFINLLALLFAALVFAGCASTDDAAPAADAAAPAADDAAPVAEAHTTETDGLLMDRYKSGEIPGYRDEHKPKTDAN
ncbi:MULTISPECIES: hypothetical protein [unclassified Lentimonas]|uniref:hypothetical protein n=1 Tax=unclassified Lentimonas TaxID=2630993 RepID=UPI001389CDD0|nr:MULTISPECIES: hypothetical protein [unclassified Lentimonas]